MERNISTLEMAAIELEISDNFKNFNSFEFLRDYDNGNITEKELNRFFYMCYLNKKFISEREKEKKELEKVKNKGG